MFIELYAVIKFYFRNLLKQKGKISFNNCLKKKTPPLSNNLLVERSLLGGIVFYFTDNESFKENTEWLLVRAAICNKKRTNGDDYSTLNSNIWN